MEPSLNIPEPSELQSRVDYGGEWWLIQSSLTVGQEREYFAVLQEITSIMADELDADRFATLETRLRALILNCTVSWSYGEVNQATLDGCVYGEHFRLVSERMRELYAPLVASAVKNLGNLYTSLSSQDGQSPQSVTNATLPT